MIQFLSDLRLRHTLQFDIKAFVRMFILFIFFLGLSSKLLFAQSVLPAYLTHVTSNVPAGWSGSIAATTSASLDACGGSAARFTSTAHVLTVNYNAAATNVTFKILKSTTGGKTIVVEESSNGTLWTPILGGTIAQANLAAINTVYPYTFSLLPASRYVRLRMSAYTAGAGRFDIDGIQVYNTTPFTCYCVATSTSTADEYISSVASGSFTNTTGRSNYANYISNGIINTVSAGSSFNVSVQVTGPWAEDIIYVYVDLDGNGNLTGTGELAGTFDLTTGTGTGTQTLTVPITIPSGTAAGTKRVRIKLGDNVTTTAMNNNPCQTYTYGEVEDYLLAVTASCTQPAAPTIGTITQPACPVTTGSAQLTGLPSSGTWTVTHSPGAVTTTGTGTSTTISGLAAGTYTFTVTDATPCTSTSSGSVVINTCPPPNDACSNATDLPCGTSGLAGTTVNSVSEVHGTGCSMSGYGVWYKFTGDGNSTTISSTAVFDHKMAIVSAFGACSGFTNVTCQDGPGAGGTETYTFTSVVGTQYYVYIGHYLSGNTTTGTFTISRTCVASPCSSVIPMTCGTSYTSPVSGTGAWNVTTCGFNTPGVETVYSYTPPSDGTYTFDISAVSGGFFDVFYKSGSCGSTGWTCLGDIDAPAFADLPLTGGTTYHFLLDPEGTSAQSTTVSISCPAVPPANDACSNATDLPCATSNLAGTTVGSVSEVHGTGCSMSGHGVWYKFTGDGNSTTISSTAVFDHKMAIVSASGACSGFTNVTCQDGPGAGGTETYTFTSVVGTQYYVYIGHYLSGNTTTGTFTISRTCAAPPTPPANDACANATDLPCATSNLAGTTVNAVLETSPGSCTAGYGVWYKFTGDGNNTTISSVATFDQGMAIFSASVACSGLTSVECVDISFGSTETSAAFTAVSGTQYYVYIAHYSGSTTGTFTISRTCVTPPADPCASVTAMTCGTTYNTSMSGSSSAWNLSSCYISGTPGQERVFSFTPATTGNYRLDVPALTGDYIDFFYRSGSCSGPSGWTCLGYLNGPGYTNLDLIGGTTYHFLLDPEGTGSYTASLNFICAPSNDACANATTLTLDAAPVTGNIASANLGSGACSGYDDYDVWYKFTTQCTGNYVVTVDPGFDFDAVFQVYEGSCSGTQVVPTAGSDLGDACIDGPFDNGNEFGTFNLQAGTTYFVRVYDFQGPFDFDIPEGSSFVIDVNNNASAINSGFATWTGNATDRLWQNSVNWDCGVVPTATTRVIIPAQVAVNRQPQINNGISADVLDIEIQGSTVDLLEVLNGGDLEVHTP